jgi:diguanylate cyclase (GGDEF)-like protein
MPDKILVVDDNPITRKLMQVGLATEGFAVKAVGLARDIDEAIQAQPPDLVVLDLVLPDATGFDVLTKLRTTYTIEQLPVLAVTGVADEDRILAAGFTDHLLKPIEPGRLADRIRLHLSAVRKPRHGTRRVLVVDDNATQLKLVELHLGCLGFDVSISRDAFEAITLARDAKPDVIVSDIVMPGFDGFQLCRAVRGDAELVHIPVVLASSRQLDHGDRDLGMRAGATAIVARTPDLGDLIAAVREHTLSTIRACAGTWPELPSTAHREAIEDLERQADRDARVAQVSRIWKAMLVVLERIGELGESPRDVVKILDDVLAGLLDALGFGLGLAYTREGDRFELRSQLGFSSARRPELVEFFGDLELLRRVTDDRKPIAFEQATVSQTGQALLARARVGSMLIAPLTRGDQRIGVIVLASLNPAVPPGWLDIAKAVTAPIAQAIAFSTAVRRPDADHRFHGIHDSLPDGVVVTDASQSIVYANPAALRILGRPADSVVGRPVSAYLSSSARPAEDEVIRLVRTTDNLVVDIVAQTVVDDPTLTLYMLRDLTERTQLATFARLANHDPLTKLFNRRRFDEAFEPKLSEARRYGCGGALLLLDIDRLRMINHRFGSLVGDAVLRRVGQVLAATTRASDVLARLGDDDFAILLPHASSADAVRCARKILEHLVATPMSVEGTAIPIDASIGISVFPDHGTARQDIIAAADSALYRAKRGGLPRVCAHDVDDIVTRIEVPEPTPEIEPAVPSPAADGESALA